MKKLIVLGMILLLAGCTVIINPDRKEKCECFPNSWYWNPQSTIPCEPFGGSIALPFGMLPPNEPFGGSITLPFGMLTPNEYTLPNWEQYKIIK